MLRGGACGAAGSPRPVGDIAPQARIGGRIVIHHLHLNVLHRQPDAHGAIERRHCLVEGGDCIDLLPPRAGERLLPLELEVEELGRETGLVQEVWRLFVTAMIAAMMFEAGLSMPHRVRSGGLGQ